MNFDGKVLNKIVRQTKQNDHGGALLTAALALGCTKIADKLVAINRQHAELGHLPFDLYHDRQEVSNELMVFAKGALSSADYQKLHDAF